jgi:hypothetical protein
VGGFLFARLLTDDGCMVIDSWIVEGSEDAE